MSNSENNYNYASYFGFPKLKRKTQDPLPRVSHFLTHGMAVDSTQACGNFKFLEHNWANNCSGMYRQGRKL